MCELNGWRIFPSSKNVENAVKHLQIFRSKPADIKISPSGWNSHENISPPWPSSNIIGPNKLDVRWTPYYMDGKSSGKMGCLLKLNHWRPNWIVWNHECLLFPGGLDLCLLPQSIHFVTVLPPAQQPMHRIPFLEPFSLFFPRNNIPIYWLFFQVFVVYEL